MAGDRRDGEGVRGAGGQGLGAAGNPRASRPLFEGGQEVRVPIVEEQVTVGKREVETGRVRVHTVVDEEKLNLTELLERDVVEIERVPVGKEVAQAPLPFEEGDVLVIPVIEERLIVEKRLVVVEEVRVRRRQERAPANIPVTRRVMHAEIERHAPPAAQPGPPASVSEPLRAAPPAGQRSFAAANNDAVRDHALPDHAAAPAGRTTPAAHTEDGPNWAMIALAVAAILLLLLVLAGRS